MKKLTIKKKYFKKSLFKFLFTNQNFKFFLYQYFDYLNFKLQLLYFV
jgi:hypothetical protein